MATQKKEAATKKSIKVRDLKPSKDAKGGVGHLDSRSADTRRADVSRQRNLNSPHRGN